MAVVALGLSARRTSCAVRLTTAIVTLIQSVGSVRIGAGFRSRANASGLRAIGDVWRALETFAPECLVWGQGQGLGPYVKPYQSADHSLNVEYLRHEPYQPALIPSARGRPNKVGRDPRVL
eukprot:2515149-Prymnesium_polylepis.1